MKIYIDSSRAFKNEKQEKTLPSIVAIKAFAELISKEFIELL